MNGTQRCDEPHTDAQTYTQTVALWVEREAHDDGRNYAKAEEFCSCASHLVRLRVGEKHAFWRVNTNSLGENFQSKF